LDVAWSRATRRASYAPQNIDIVANMVCAASEDFSVLQWRGVAAVALADRLESAGYRVRIVVAFKGETSEHDPKPYCCSVVVKDHDKPLDVATVATVTMPGFFRALGFSWILRHASGQLSPGIGRSKNWKRQGDEIVLDYDGVRTRDTAIAFVTEQIEKLENPAAAA
jgi:hypothetical protein